MTRGMEDGERGRGKRGDVQNRCFQDQQDDKDFNSEQAQIPILIKRHPISPQLTN